MKTIAVIGARLNSSRLPGKHLRLIQGMPLISHVQKRLQQCANIDDIILATTSDPFNTPLSSWAESANLRYFCYTGDVDNLVGRIDSVMQQEQANYLVYICGDCPLIDPGFIDHALSHLAHAKKKETIQLKDNIQSLHEGMSFYSKAGWKKLVDESNDNMTQEHVGYAHSRNPFLNTLRIEDNDDHSEVKHRISVDTESDLEFMNQVYGLWYQDNNVESIVDLKWVHDQLRDNPWLIEINQHVNQKKPNQRYGNISLFCHVGSNIGIGHLSRCAKIAKYLKENLSLGIHIFILGTQQSLPWLDRDVSWFSSDIDFYKEILNCSADALVIDLHPEQIQLKQLEEIVSELRKKEKNKIIIAIDKLDTLLKDIDLLYIPSFFTRISSPKISFGWNHYFIDSPSMPIKNKQRKKTITVLTGGSDALGFGEYLTELIEPNVPLDWSLRWVQGPYAPRPKTGKASRWQVIHNPDNMSDIMSESTIVLSAYGLSLFESIALSGGVIALPANQLCEEDELAALEESSACLVCRNTEDIEENLRKLINNESLRDKLNKKSGTIFSDNAGYHKFSQKLLALLGDKAPS